MLRLLACRPSLCGLPVRLGAGAADRDTAWSAPHPPCAASRRMLCLRLAPPAPSSGVCWCYSWVWLPPCSSCAALPPRSRGHRNDRGGLRLLRWPLLRMSLATHLLLPPVPPPSGSPVAPQAEPPPGRAGIEHGEAGAALGAPARTGRIVAQAEVAAATAHADPLVGSITDDDQGTVSWLRRRMVTAAGGSATMLSVISIADVPGLVQDPPIGWVGAVWATPAGEPGPKRASSRNPGTSRPE
jgi:hypothetical protein